MDHKQLATPFWRRRGLLCPNRNSCSLIERPPKPRFKEWLSCAPDAGAGLSQHSFQKSPYAPLFSRIAFVLAPRGMTTFVLPFLRSDNDTRQGFSEAGDPLLRNLRGADASRESLNQLACYSRHMRGQGLRPLHLAAFKSNPRFFEPPRWYSRAGCRQSMLACFPIRSGQRQSDRCFSEADNPLWQNLRGV